MLSMYQGHRSPINIRFTDTKRPSAHRRVVEEPIQRGVISRTMSAFGSTNLYDTPSTTDAYSVEMAGFEPATFALQRRCSPAELHPQELPG
jgi:hypothetical protein